MPVFLLSFLIFLGAVAEGSVRVGEPVLQLLTTQNRLVHTEGQVFDSFSAQILVKNLCYQKTIHLVLESAGVSPQTLEARYQGPAADGYELWAVAGTVEPRTYTLRALAQLDKPYELPLGSLEPSSGAFLHRGQDIQALTLGGRAHPGQRLRFEALARKGSENARVWVHLSQDHWRTETVLPLEPQAKASSTRIDGVALSGDLWSADISLPVTPGNLEYIFSFDEDEKIFWDSNFGRNYQLQID